MSHGPRRTDQGRGPFELGLFVWMVDNSQKERKEQGRTTATKNQKMTDSHSRTNARGRWSLSKNECEEKDSRLPPALVRSSNLFVIVDKAFENLAPCSPQATLPHLLGVVLARPSAGTAAKPVHEQGYCFCLCLVALVHDCRHAALGPKKVSSGVPKHVVEKNTKGKKMMMHGRLVLQRCVCPQNKSPKQFHR